MKNKLLNCFINISILIFIFQINYTFAEELNITSSNISIDNKTKILILDGDVKIIDEKNNKLFTDNATYNKTDGIVETTGKTEILTSEGFKITTSEVKFNDKEKTISSEFPAIIIDKDGNKINVELFNYLINKNLFFSKGKITITDKNKNSYNFSEIFIDEKQNKIVGSDVKLFLNQEDIKINKNNEPRFFANTMTLSKNINRFEKGVFTYCKNRGENKCPPWELRAKKIKHNTAKKTIYYDSAVIKIYDFPIFYFPKFSHPDPTVKRRSGFLVPSITDSSNVGAGFQIPYFWSISNDKDLTFSPKLYGRENPLYLAEYRQDFERSYLIVDTSYNKGYKKLSNKKTTGSRSHFFTKFNYNFFNDSEKFSDLDLTLQHGSNDTYFKIHNIDTALVNKENTVLENRLAFNYQDDEIFFGANLSAFNDMTKKDNSKYEYILPVNLEKNLITSERSGRIDWSSRIKLRNYEVDKQTDFFVNDFKWNSNKWTNKFGLQNQFQGIVKTVNYEAENAPEFKTDKSTSEISGALGYLTKLNLFKKDSSEKNYHLLTPKMLIRYAPGHMRDVKSGDRLKYTSLYDLNKVNEIDVLENGLSASIGLNYEKRIIESDGDIGPKKIELSIGQVISEKENLDIPSASSLEQRFSDVVGNASYKFNEKFDLTYDFALDQNYREFNYNEVGTSLKLDRAKFNINYLEEKQHIGNQKYVKSDFNIDINESANLSFETKRNLLTNSAEFYNLSYDYINDCLKAGILFRREFYTDRDIEPEDSIMFRISIIPFAEIKSPTFSK